MPHGRQLGDGVVDRAASVADTAEMNKNLSQNHPAGVWQAWAAGLVLLLALGCGGRALQPVEGKLTLKGGGDPAQLKDFTVNWESLEPGPDGNPVSAWGVVAADGSFTVGRDKIDEGLVVGKYRLAITAPTPMVDTPLPKPTILGKYHDFAKSGLEVEIVPGVNKVALELEPARK